MERRRAAVRGGVLATAGVALVTLLGSASWACTPQASLKMSVPGGPAGTNVTVTGSTFDASGSAVKLWWGGAGKTFLGTANVAPATRQFTFAFSIPDTGSGVKIVSATQNDSSGQAIAGSPVNTTFRVDGAPVTINAANVQVDPDNSVTEPVSAAAPAVAAAPAATAAPAPAPAPVAATPAVRTAPRVRVARVTSAAPAQAAVAAPAPAAAPVAAPAPAAPVAAPAPVATPAPVAAPATAPARRSVMVSMSSDSSGSPALAIALVGVGLVLALGASAVVLAGRRESKAPAKVRR